MHSKIKGLQGTVFAGLLLSVLLAGCSVLAGLGIGDSALSPPDIPAPPPIPQVIATDHAALAAELANSIANASNETERLAAWLSVYQALGIPVIAEDSTSITNTGDDPLGPPYWVVWYTSGMDRPKRGMPLTDAGKILTATPDGTFDPNAGQILLGDLRAAVHSSDPYEQLLGLFVRERVWRGASGGDLMDAQNTPDALIIDPATVQLLRWVLMRNVLFHIAIAETPTSSLHLASYSVNSSDPNKLSAAPRCAEGFGSEEATTVVNWILNKYITGADIPLTNGVKGMAERFLETINVSPDRIGKIKGAVAGANAIGTLVSFYMQVQALEVEWVGGPNALERSKTTRDGEEITLQFRLFYDKKKADGDKLWACMASFITNAFGVNFTLPSSQNIPGAEVTFSPGKNIPEKVLINSSNPGHRFTTDGGGIVALPLIGRGQKENLPESALSYTDTFTVKVSAQPEALTASSIGNMFWDSLSFWALPGVPAAVGPLVDLMKTMSYNLGEFEFGLNDWRSPAYRAGGRMSGTFCLVTPSTLDGSGFIFHFNPSSEEGGSMSFNFGQELSSVSGCNETGTGDYSVKLDNEKKSGTVTWSASAGIACPGLGSFDVFNGSHSFDITADPDASCE